MAKAKNPLRIDPTRTATLRRSMAQMIRRRFAALRSKLYALIVKEDAFGLVPKKPLIGNVLVLNAPRWQFNSTSEQVKAFRDWIKAQFKLQLTSEQEDLLWEKYIKDGLKKGAGRSFDDVRSRMDETDKEKLSFYKGSREEFLRSSFAQPEAVEKVKLLAGRTFTELEGVTDAMSTVMTRTLTDGLVQGKGPAEIARSLNRALDIGRSRAETIARTELIRAHAEGQLMAMEALGVEEVGAAVEWSTADDEAVCELCAPLEGVVLTIDEARGMLPRHPNCRCAWVPANVGEDDSKQKDTKASIREALQTSIEREGRKETEWVGADAEIAKTRPKSGL